MTTTAKRLIDKENVVHCMIDLLAEEWQTSWLVGLVMDI